MAAPMNLFRSTFLRPNSEHFNNISRRIFCVTCSNFQRHHETVREEACHRRFHSTGLPLKLKGQNDIHCQKQHLYALQTCVLHQTLFKKSVTFPHIQCRNVSDDHQRNVEDESLIKKEKENIYTVPNLLTISRIVLTPVIGYYVVQDSYSIALGLFTYAGLSDLLDGYIARNFKNQMSAFGTALDPLADKLMITVLTVTLTISNLIPAFEFDRIARNFKNQMSAFGTALDPLADKLMITVLTVTLTISNLIPVPLAVLIVGRDALLVLCGFVIRYVSLPPPKTLKRYFDVTYPTAKLIPSKLSKWNTANQILLVMLTLAAPVFEFVDHPALQGLWYLTAATTFGSGIDYIINWRSSIKYLKV